MSWLPLAVLEKYRYVPSCSSTRDGLNSAAALFGPLRTELAGLRVGLSVCGANLDVDGFAKLVREGAGDRV